MPERCQVSGSKVGNPAESTSALAVNEAILVCPGRDRRCMATSIDGGKSWSRAGSCHLGPDTVPPQTYVPRRDADEWLPCTCAGRREGLCHRNCGFRSGGGTSVA